mmetsp:Transcript_55540/g.153182  ORF Transcript_55540/g.153182 Transcript_55540/m.153182 type:complete len:135 (-) Transcript_55540:1635-2039(-)
MVCRRRQAFPCNQFGNQEPGTVAEIKSFARERGARFLIMDKIDVNGKYACARASSAADSNTSTSTARSLRVLSGGKAHDVYRFLKAKTGTSNIGWNFGTYFLVDAAGNAEAYHGVSPMQLDGIIKQKLAIAHEL